MTNNNSSMATVVETFYIEETVNLIHDTEALTKWNDRVAELGLEGQKTVVKEDKSPIPFLWMNQALISTFETLCPTKTTIEKFSQSPIPVELLDTVSLCKRERYFDKIEVWYNEKDKDPVIVGYLFDQKETGWSKEFYAKKYLIGRWADVKASLDTLIDRAKKIFIAENSNRLKMEIKQKERELEDIGLITENRFGAAMPLPTILPF